MNTILLLSMLTHLFSTILSPDPVRATKSAPGLVPLPHHVALDDKHLRLPANWSWSSETPGMASTLSLFTGQLGLLHGITPSLTTTSASQAFLRFHRPLASDTLGAEGYRLEISDKITITAEPAGAFYALQTLSQLLSVAEGRYQVPTGTIIDKPRFAWRGMHLDVARHFRSVDFVKRYIDLMSHYKMNTLHWHLTEDQGWRIEIKAFPRLTEVGAWRKETMVAKNFNPYVGDGIPHGGFYTQEQIREIVAYAAERHITVVPEIEMPGHAVAALAAYPEFACTQGPFEVATTWGVFEDVFCPTEPTFAFLEQVLKEVVTLFPSKYIHIGGDEVPKKRWKESHEAQEVMRREGLKDEYELQSYFIRRIERFLNQQGRILIGWDEILEGGLAPNAVVMSWRGETGGIEAANHGHDVVMTPGFALYFDHYQGAPESEPLAIGGFTPMEKVYRYEPVPAALAEDKRQHVLGAQANVWTEYMKTDAHIEYMIFPRMMALSERVWSRSAVRDYKHFQQRLLEHYPRLDAMNVNYRLPEPMGWDQLKLQDTQVNLQLETAMPGGCFQLTLDGNEPNASTPCEAVRSDILSVPDGGSLTLKVVSQTADGRRSTTRTLQLPTSTTK
jgi:hexosaminidase